MKRDPLPLHTFESNEDPVLVIGDCNPDELERVYSAQSAAPALPTSLEDLATPSPWAQPRQLWMLYGPPHPDTLTDLLGRITPTSRLVLVDPQPIGSTALDAPGYDLLSLVTGSEGMLAVTTEVTVKLVPKPQLARCIMASFDDIRQAGDAVAAVIAAGIIPAGLEMMDKPMTAAVEDYVHAGYDLSAAAILLCESDGTPEEVAEEIGRMSAVLRRCGATAIAVNRDEAERLKFWSGRKNAFPASGRISPDYMCMDSTIPRKRLADILLAIQQMEKKYQLRCANVFHAGDGNLHPLIMFDANDPDQLRRCELFGADILETSVAMGGTVTGEHGVGVEKLNSMCVQFSAAENEQMFGVKRAFDAKGLLNPGKVIPTLHRCAEYGKMLVRAGQIKHPELPRF